VDITIPEVEATLNILEFFAEKTDAPYVVACTKQDHKNALPVETIKNQLGLNAVPILPCVATDRESVKQVLLVLLHQIMEKVQ
jgi:hypothetical protein